MRRDGTDIWLGWKVRSCHLTAATSSSPAPWNSSEEDLMNTDKARDPFVLRRYVALAVKNLRRRPVRTVLTVAGVALAVTVAVSLGGFMLGYRGAIDKSIQILGFQVMIMA